MLDPLKKAVQEARIWLDMSNSKKDRHNARCRFDYALDQIKAKGVPPTPIERIQLHMVAVELAKQPQEEPDA